MKIILLGTGTSQGIPVIGCSCAVCKSRDPHNNRNRSSALIIQNGISIVIDTATEFRIQMLKNNIKNIDAVLFTHAHADHVHGLDDIRQFNEIHGKTIPCFGNYQTIYTIRQKYDYVFNPTQQGGGKPDISLNVVNSDFDIFGIKIIPLPVKHGKLDILGYRMDKFAYITDASYIPDETMHKIKGLDVLVINALRFEPHDTHFSVTEALEVIEKVKPRKTFLTHICHKLDHKETQKKLPKNVQMGFDGLLIEIEKE